MKMRTIEMNGDKVAELEAGDDMFAMAANVQREFPEWRIVEVKDATGTVIFSETNPDAE